MAAEHVRGVMMSTGMVSGSRGGKAGKGVQAAGILLGQHVRLKGK